MPELKLYFEQVEMICAFSLDLKFDSVNVGKTQLNTWYLSPADVDLSDLTSIIRDLSATGFHINPNKSEFTNLDSIGL